MSALGQWLSELVGSVRGLGSQFDNLLLWFKESTSGKMTAGALRSVFAVVPGLGVALSGTLALHGLYTELGVSAFGTVDVPSGVFLQMMCWFNSVLPVQEVFASLVWYVSVKTTLTLYRFAKSWAPTVA